MSFLHLTLNTFPEVPLPSSIKKSKDFSISSFDLNDIEGGGLGLRVVQERPYKGYEGACSGEGSCRSCLDSSGLAKLAFIGVKLR